MSGPSQAGLVRKVFFGPWGLRAGWRLLIFNVAFNLFGVLMKLILVPVVGKEPEWTAANFILIEMVSLAGSAGCIYLMARIERRRFADYGFTRQNSEADHVDEKRTANAGPVGKRLRPARFPATLCAR